MWQNRIKKLIKHLVLDHSYHVVHHLTLGSFRMPFSVTGYGVASVVGPVGGCEIFLEHLLPEGESKIRLREQIRNVITLVHERYGVGMERYKAVSLTLSCTKEMSRVFGKWGIKSPVFPNIGLHHEQVTSTPKDYSKANCDGGLKLLFVGNLLYWKGLELAVEAMDGLPENVTLCCVGTGADREAFASLIKRRNLNHRIESIGSIARDKLLEKYAAFDVFLFPSLHDSGGMVVVEAMRAGLPTICLDAGGPAISVTSKCGRVVQLGSKEDVVKGLHDAVIYYLENPGMIAEHGEYARNRVQAEYDWSKNAVRMLDCYHSAIKTEREKLN